MINLIDKVETARDSKLRLDPQLYDILTRSYSVLADDSCQRSILISGESGGGKTEPA